MNRLMKRLLRVIPYVRELEAQVKNQGTYAAGHYYSPIPDHRDVDAHLNEQESRDAALPDVHLNQEEQFAVL